MLPQMCVLTTTGLPRPLRPAKCAFSRCLVVVVCCLLLLYEKKQRPAPPVTRGDCGTPKDILLELEFALQLLAKELKNIEESAFESSIKV